MELEVCEVCKRLDDDWNLKWCSFCNLCGAWICQADLNNWFRRGMAALN
jgi:hypothetical protein